MACDRPTQRGSRATLPKPSRKAFLTHGSLFDVPAELLPERDRTGQL